MSIFRIGQLIECVEAIEGITVGEQYIVRDDDHGAVEILDDTNMVIDVPDNHFRCAFDMCDKRLCDRIQDNDALSSHVEKLEELLRDIYQSNMMDASIEQKEWRKKIDFLVE